MAGKLWTEEELDFLKNNYDKLTTKEIAAHIGNGRTYRAVMGKMQRLGLTKIFKSVPGNPWAKEEIDFLKRNYKEFTCKEMAAALTERSHRSISGKLAELGLIKQVKTKLSLETDYKICPVCKQKKPKTEFFNSSERYDGVKSTCKKCCYEANVRYKQNKKLEKLKAVTIAAKQHTENEMFKCSKCGKIKPGNQFYFLKSRNKRDTKCIECSKKINKKQVITRILEGKDW